MLRAQVGLLMRTGVCLDKMEANAEMKEQWKISQKRSCMEIDHMNPRWMQPLVFCDYGRQPAPEELILERFLGDNNDI